MHLYQNLKESDLSALRLILCRVIWLFLNCKFINEIHIILKSLPKKFTIWNILGQIPPPFCRRNTLLYDVTLWLFTIRHVRSGNILHRPWVREVTREKGKYNLNLESKLKLKLHLYDKNRTRHKKKKFACSRPCSNKVFRWLYAYSLIFFNDRL